MSDDMARGGQRGIGRTGLLGVLFLLLSAFLPWGLILLEVAAAEVDPCEGVDGAFISRHAPFRRFVIVAQAGVPGGLCELVLDMEGDILPVYASKEKDFLVAGDLFHQGKHVTMAAHERLRAKELARLKEDIERAVAFSYKPPESSGRIYFFTDPDCSYCETAKRPLREWADSNRVEVRVMMHPLDIHPSARDKAVRAVCSAMTYESYLSNSYGAETCQEGRDKIALSSRTAEALGITGTPAFMNESGDVVMGFNVTELKKLLKLKQ